MKHKKNSRSERKFLNQIIYRNDGYRKDAEQFNLVDDSFSSKAKTESRQKNGKKTSQ